MWFREKDIKKHKQIGLKDLKVMFYLMLERNIQGILFLIL
jgi:hypothetical protein